MINIKYNPELLMMPVLHDATRYDWTKVVQPKQRKFSGASGRGVGGGGRQTDMHHVPQDIEDS